MAIKKPNKYEIYLNKRAMGKSPKRIYSIRDSTTNIVRFSNSAVLLENVEMIVQPSGRADTLNRLKLKSKVTRTVHSFLRGTLLYRGKNAIKKAKEIGLSLTNEKTNAIGYDPQKSDQWLLIDGYKMPDNINTNKPITSSRYALLHERGILVI